MSEPVFVNGPPIVPATELAAWLAGHKGSLLRLPLVVEVRAWEVGPAWIGMNADDPPDDAIWIELDQGALSVGLTERLLPLCETVPARCVAWIQGYWGPTVDLPGPPGPFPGTRPEAPFSVREVVGLVGPHDPPHIRVVRR